MRKHFVHWSHVSHVATPCTLGVLCLAFQHVYLHAHLVAMLGMQRVAERQTCEVLVAGLLDIDL